MEAALHTIREELEAGGMVYVPCHGGIGRTGTLVGCYLKEEGHENPLQTLQQLTDAEREFLAHTPDR